MNSLLKKALAPFLLENWSIHYKILAGMIFIITVPIILLLAVQTRFISTLLVDTRLQSLSHTTQVAAQLIEQELDIALLNIETINQTPSFTLNTTNYARTILEGNTPTERVIYRTIQHMEQATDNDYIRNIRLLSLDGTLLERVGNPGETRSIINTDQSQHPTYTYLSTHNTTQETLILIPPYADPVTDEMLLEIGTLIVDSNTLVGYMIYTLTPETILQIPLISLQNNNTNVEATETYFVVNQNGWLLTPAYGATAFDQQITIDAPQEATNTTYTRSQNGETITVFSTQQTLTNYPWTVVADIDSDSIRISAETAAITSNIPMITAMIVIAVIILLGSYLTIARPLHQLTAVTQQIANGDLTADIKSMDISQKHDEIGILANAIAKLSEQMHYSIDYLEQRVRVRTHNIEITSAISREAFMTQDIDQLLKNIVNMIVGSFPHIYHAQVFMLDDNREYANLVASTGQAGQELLRRKHRLAVGSISVIGRVAALGETVIARDTATDKLHKFNEFLPATRAEMALPLLYNGQILGALDMQSQSADAFTYEEQIIGETLASQISVAIKNANVFAELQTRAEQAESLNRMMTHIAWEEMLTTARRKGYLEAVVSDTNITTTDTEWSPWQQEAAAKQMMVSSPPQPDGTCILAVPIILRGEILGVVEWQVASGNIDDNTRQMAQKLVDRLILTLENIRLLERSERLAERERLVNQISSQLDTEPNIPMILETAVQELATILQTPQVNIQLKRPNNTTENGSRGNS